MANIDLERRAEIGRQKRARTRAQIVEAGATLFGGRSQEAPTVDAVVEAAGVAKGTFYYHFKSIGDLAAAVGAGLSQSFDELMSPARLERRDAIERFSFAFMKFLERASTDPDWARLVIQSAQSPIEFGIGVRANLKADIEEAIAQGRVTVRDVELAADIAIGIWLEVTRGIIARGPRPETTGQALDATLRALGLGPH